MKVIVNPFTILLGPDDMPTCPVHGVRIVTDYIEGDEEDPYPREVGPCPICRKVYRFESDERVKL